jgi:hypothetical protein
VQGSECRVQGSGSRGYILEMMVQGLILKVPRVGIRV